MKLESQHHTHPPTPTHAHRHPPLEMQDEVDGLKENTVLGIRVLDLLRLVGFLCLVDNGVQCLTQSGPHHWVS